MKLIEKVEIRKPKVELSAQSDGREEIRREIAEAFVEYHRQIEEIRAHHGRKTRSSLAN